MISTWLNEQELKQFSSVEDKELNEILQEVRKVFNGVFFIQTTRYDHRTWFDRLTGNYLKTGKAYTLYLSVNNFDAQVIKLCTESQVVN